jgi:uncharacterized protein (TIRG00374 family)
MDKTLKKYLVFALKLCVSGTLLYLVLGKAGAGNVAALLGNINPASFAAAVAIYLVVLFIGTIRWRLLLPGRFALGRLFSLHLVGSFFNTFLPGLVGGDAVKIYYLYKETGEGANALSSVFMDRYVGFCALMMIGLAAYPFGLRYVRGSWIEWLLPLIIICFVLASLVVFGLRLGRRIEVVGKLHDYFHEYRKKRAVIAKALLLSFSLQLLIMFGIYLMALGLGIEIPFRVLLVFIPIITTVATVPVSLAGIGLREAATVLLLGTVGVEADSAMALSLAWFMMVAVGGLAGLLEYFRMKEARRGSEAP